MNEALGIALEALCVCLVSLFLGFCCVPALHSPARRLLRPLAVHHVESGLWAVSGAQRLESLSLTAAFKWSSHAVSVGFYVSGLRTQACCCGCTVVGRGVDLLQWLQGLRGRAVQHAHVPCTPIQHEPTPGLLPPHAGVAGPARALLAPGAAGALGRAGEQAGAAS